MVKRKKPRIKIRQHSDEDMNSSWQDGFESGGEAMGEVFLIVLEFVASRGFALVLTPISDPSEDEES